MLIITRPGSSTPASLFPKAAKYVVVDVTDSKSLASVLSAHSIQVVISTVPYAGIELQHQQASAAKSAGVKLFVPSEFGFPTLDHKEGALAVKEAFAGAEKSATRSC